MTRFISSRVNVELFLDRLNLPIDKATREAMGKAGAFIRRTGITSLRRRKKPSAPGSPPSVHTRDSYSTLKNIRFYYDPVRKILIVGIVKTNQIFIGPNGPATGTVPHVLEYGGAVGVIEVRKWGKWRRADLRSRRRNAELPTRVRSVDIAARPTMGPALIKTKPQLPAHWGNSLKAS